MLEVKQGQLTSETRNIAAAIANMMRTASRIGGYDSSASLEFIASPVGFVDSGDGSMGFASLCALEGDSEEAAIVDVEEVWERDEIE
jgi:hypothetical protein